MQTQKTIRCFVSLPLPKQVKNEIVRIQSELKKQNLFNGKFTHPDNLHLTLKFLGEITEKELISVDKQLKKLSNYPFEIQLSDPGVFSRNYIRIIWMHLLGANQIQAKIDKALSSLFPVEKRFMSHITLARVKSLKSKNHLLAFIDRIEYTSISACVDQVYLMKSKLSSQGPTYEVLETYP